MNKRFLAGPIILVLLCCSVSMSYACNLSPEAYISDCPKYTGVDDSVNFSGLYSTDHDGYIVDWQWTFPPQAYDITYVDPWEVGCYFNAPGIYTVNLEVTDDDGATGNFECTVNVIKMDLTIIGAPGGYIAVNTDDDNKNSTQDRNEFETVDYENDLVEISLSMAPLIEGRTKLQVVTFEGIVSVWGDETKSISVINPNDPVEPTMEADCNLSEGPQTLWVEAYLVHNTLPYGGLVLSYIHPVMGHTVDWDWVQFKPVEVRLIMDGVNEDNEEFPGNYILYNKDDDDNDGVPDYEDDENPSEDDLVKIMPHCVEPHECTICPDYCLTGQVTFDVSPPVGTKVKVWTSKTKGTEISLPQTYATPDDLPKEFYVEGIDPSDGPRDVVFTLTYDNLGPNFKDKVMVTVVEVELFRDENYTQVLDDWPKSGGLRSPKYIFGEDDPIYVQVRNIGTDPDTVEIKYDVVSVNSATGGLAYLTLYETGVDTQIFNNSESPGELLYLSTENSEGSGDKIKVTDEEVLYCWLKMPPRDGGVYKMSEDVMVDRGEFLAVAGSECDILWINRCWTDFNLNISTANLKMSNDYKWWQNGYMLGKYYSKGSDMTTEDEQYEQSKETAIDAGCVSGFSCADFSFYSGHGESGTMKILITDTTFQVNWYPNILNPDRGFGWSDDLEFCIFSACDVLGREGDPSLLVNRWINEFFNKKLHAVLGTCEKVSVAGFSNDLGKFIDKLKTGLSVVNAYKQACYIGINTPYGILVREENLNDYILTPVSSAGNSLSRDYTTIDNTFYYFYYDGNQQIINPAQEGEKIPDSDRYYNIKRKIAEAMEFKDEIQIDILSLDEQEQPLSISEKDRSLFEHSRMEKFSFSGWNKIEDTKIVKHNVKIPEMTEWNYLTSLGLEMQSDYVLDSRGKMMVSKYNANPGGMHQLGETWCEGEIFDFIREYNGHMVFDDRSTVAIQNNDVVSYTLTEHPLMNVGTMIIKKPHFNFKDDSIKQQDLDISIVYRIKGVNVLPVWQVEYKNYIFHYTIQ